MPDDASDHTTSRLSLYLRALCCAEGRGRRLVASAELARATGVKSALVRKDLAHFGQFGIRGVGYEIRSLRTHIAGILGLDCDRNVVVIGAGNLGRALATARNFNVAGFRTLALFDKDPAKARDGSRGQLPVRPMRELPSFVRRNKIEVAVLAVPAAAAQPALDSVIAAGIRAVLNFGPSRLEAPAGVHVRSVDLKIHLEGLAHWLCNHPLRDPASR